MAIWGAIGPALQIAGAVGGLFGGGDDAPEFEQPNIDFDAEFAKMDALYGSQETALEQGAILATADARKAIVSDLAARGIYESPVGEKSLSQQRSQMQGALLQAKSQIKAQQANAKSGLMSKMLDYKMRTAENIYKSRLNQWQQGRQDKASLWSSLGGLGTGIPGLVSAIQGMGTGGGSTSGNMLNVEQPWYFNPNASAEDQAFPMTGYSGRRTF